jgi:hypothetical protein
VPNQTDHILSYLPRTFQALPKPTALYSVAAAFGNELLAAENSLVDFMRAHWVDTADKDAELLRDLACLAVLYGLTPRGAEPALASPTCLPVPADEGIEDFREHLKRYIRTFLDGTVTMQGITRIVAEALGLHVADEYAAMDTWWTRPGDELVIREPHGADATTMVFGFDTHTAIGSADQSASITGSIDLSTPIDLSGSSILRLKIDNTAPIVIDLASRLPNTAAASLDQIASAIDFLAQKTIARHDGRFLTLGSPSSGPLSRLEVQDGDNDAALPLLGLRPRSYRGADATAARLVGTPDLSGGVDLSELRYLRVFVDGTRLAEIDCAGSQPGATTLDEIVSALNAALGDKVAAHNGHVLTLTLPTIGFSSTLQIQPAAAQDASQRLFGSISSFQVGRAPQAATVTGTRNLSRGADLSRRASVRVRVNDAAAVTINCAGADPAHTTLPEIVATLNLALGAPLASHDGRFLTLATPAAGATSSLVFALLPPDDDATDDLFGIGQRSFHGHAATAARVIGLSDLSSGIDLAARHLIQITIDDAAPLEVSVRTHAANSRQVMPNEIVAAINAAAGQAIASHDGQHLILTSPVSGADSRVALQPIEAIRRRRFVTRTFITDEATQAVFGFINHTARGQAATVARLTGMVDLSRGVDLREARFLRLAVDGQPAREIDFTANATVVPRLRVALPDEIVAAINAFLGSEVAKYDGSRLTLTSRMTGAESRIAFEAPRSADASKAMLGFETGVARGRDATRVSFVATTDLSAGVDLSAASHIKIGLDSTSPIEIDCAGVDPAHTKLNEIAMAINVALNSVVARHDGQRLSLTSALSGVNSRLEFAVPVSSDATAILFGIPGPRVYHGANAEPARLVGTSDLSGNVNLSVARFLRLSIDNQAPREVDCAAKATDASKTTLSDIVAAIKEALGPAIASHDGRHLILASATPGAAAKLEVLPCTSGDARRKLFGDVPDTTIGKAPTPATISGDVDLLTPVNLGERRSIRLAIDGARPIDINVSGAAPDRTFLDEIVTKINAVAPNLASATDDDRLRLTSPTAGEHSQLDVLPLRSIDVIEYPPETIDAAPHPVRHGDSWRIENDGAAETDLEVEIYAPRGVAVPMLVNRTEGWRIRVNETVRPGERVRVWRDPDAGLHAVFVGTNRAAHLVVESLGAPDWLDVRALRLPLGLSEWTYLDCYGSRFNHDRFNQARFAGEPCRERGVLNVSRFASRTRTGSAAAFSSPAPLSDPPVEVRTRWVRHRQGAFVVSLPADLPATFGGRFNQARFASSGDTDEVYEGVVSEPLDDPNHWTKRLAGSKLIKANAVARAPIGFEAMLVPFRRPRMRLLSGGTATDQARLYLSEDDVPGVIELRACQSGEWGNAIGITVQQAGPARFDVAVSFQGGRFENARRIALAGRIYEPGEYPFAALAEELLKPGPIGVLQAKAAGMQADVIRERTQPNA